MQFDKWFGAAANSERKRVAKEAGTTVGYLIQLAGGHRQPSPGLSRLLEQATEGKVTKEEMRPDIWG